MRLLIDWCFFTGKNYSFLATAQEDNPSHSIIKGEKLKLKFFDRFNKNSQFSDIILNRNIDVELVPNPSTALVNGFTVKFYSCSNLKCVS